MHEHCWDGISKKYHSCCIVCYLMVRSKTVTCSIQLSHYSACLIQKVFRGYLYRLNGNITERSSEKHDLINNYKSASKKLTKALEVQNENIDIVLTTVSRDLEWARDVMKTVDFHEKPVDWDKIMLKINHNQDCPICLLEIPSENMSITSCGHCIHTDCLCSLFDYSSKEETHIKCPMCRSYFKYKIIEKLF